jgi:hypothetical protein
MTLTWHPLGKPGKVSTFPTFLVGSVAFYTRDAVRDHLRRHALAVVAILRHGRTVTLIVE